MTLEPRHTRFDPRLWLRLHNEYVATNRHVLAVGLIHLAVGLASAAVVFFVWADKVNFSTATLPCPSAPTVLAVQVAVWVAVGAWCVMGLLGAWLAANGGRRAWVPPVASTAASFAVILVLLALAQNGPACAPSLGG